MEKTRAERAVKKIERAMADLEAGKISRYKALDIIFTTVNEYFEIAAASICAGAGCTGAAHDRPAASLGAVFPKRRDD